MTIWRPTSAFKRSSPDRIRDIPPPLELFQLHGPGLRASFPPLRTSSFSASVIMAVVAVDEVQSSRRAGLEDDRELIAWQRGLIESLRGLSDNHDGRYLKFFGDGCHVAFEDPRAAVALATGVHGLGAFRVRVALGLVEVVESELVGRTVYEAHLVMRTVGSGVTACSSVMQAVCPDLP